jgi:hypothetical protein
VWPEPGGRSRNGFLAAKNQTGLDHYQVRKRSAWYTEPGRWC